MDRLIATNSVPLASADTAPDAGTAQYATDGSPANGVPATIFPAYAFNAIQEELIAVIAGGDITPDRTNNAQVLAALKALFAAVNGSTSNRFSVATPVASTDAAQLAQIGSVRSTRSTLTSGSITSADAGRPIAINASGTTQAVDTSSMTAGMRFYVYANYTSGEVTTLNASSGNFISIANITQTSIILYPGEEVIFTYDGQNLSLETLSTNLRYSAAFKSTIGTSGYQKLPSGLIIQWGMTTTSSSGAVTQALPVTFPNQMLSVVATPQTSSQYNIGTLVYNFSTTSFAIGAINTANTWQAYVVGWIALGY